jgi:hypothetical protein
MSEEFSFTGWLSDGAKGFRSTLRMPGCGLVPEEFRQHLRTSRKEFLLAFRSLFDSAIDRVDKPKGSARKKTPKIKVE